MNMLASYDVREIQIQIHVESPKNKKTICSKQNDATSDSEFNQHLTNTPRPRQKSSATYTNTRRSADVFSKTL